MRVADVMTRNVITVCRQASIQEAAALLVRHSVSGLPVVDALETMARVRGIDSHLLVRSEAPGGSWV
jgi:CBS-domain-containing membrane protein